MRKPKQLVFTSIICGLLLSNIILVNNFSRKSNEYEQLIQEKDRNYSFLNTFVRKKQDKIEVLTEKIEQKDSQIHKLKQLLEKAEKENESPTKQISISRGNSANQKMYFVVTAYTSGYESTGKYPSHPAYGITASGTKVKENRTIACPKSMPFGTKVKIDSVGYRICEDRGSAIVEGRLDLYIEDYREAINFGKQTLLIEVLEGK
jgi:3D (Asp-Asp-Asp) domain-containing protein